MTMHPGMILFGIFDSIVAFFLVYYVVKAKFGGEKKAIARFMAAFLGTVVGAIYFGLIVWFNTSINTVSFPAQMVIYFAPIVFSILMIILVKLAQPPKEDSDEEKDSEDNKDKEDASNNETADSSSDDNEGIN